MRFYQSAKTDNDQQYVDDLGNNEEIEYDPSDQHIEENEENDKNDKNKENKDKDNYKQLKTDITNPKDVSVYIKDKLQAPPKLVNIKEWNRWEKQMKTYLAAMGLLQFIESPSDNDESGFYAWLTKIPGYQGFNQSQIGQMKQVYITTVPENDITDVREPICQNRIQTNISSDLFSVIQTAATAYEMWHTLKEHCQGEAHGERLVLQQRFQLLRLEPTVSIQKFTTTYRNLMNDMTKLGICPTDFEQCNKILNILPTSSYGDFVSYYRYQLESLTASTLLNLLRTEAVRLQNWDKPFKRPNLFNGGRGRGNGRGRSGGRGRGRGRSVIAANPTNDIVCYRCWKPGHRSNECTGAAVQPPDTYSHLADRAVINRISAINAEKPPNGNYNEFNCASVTMNSMDYDNLCTNHDNCQPLGIDSCSSIHLLNRKEYFDSFEELPKIVTSTACNGEIATSKGGAATVMITNADGSHTKLHFKEAYYSPSIPINLFSTTQYSQNSNGGKSVCDANGAVIYTNNWEKVFDAKIRCGVPLAHMSSSTVAYTNLKKKTKAPKQEIWHNRLGHISIDKLNDMAKNHTVLDLDYKIVSRAQLRFCEGCAAGKQVKKSFNKVHEPRTMEPRREFSTDLTGPFRTKSKQGNYYGQVVCCTGSRLLITIGVKAKSESPNNIQKLILLIQNQFNEVLKEIKSDDAGEMRTASFTKFLDKLGIKLTISISDAHEQNALAERGIRTLMDGTRVVLHVSKLPASFWEYALHFMAHVYNLRCHPALDGASPYQRFFKKTPSVKHLRVFGSHCFVLDNVKNRNKIKPRSFPGRLIGFNTDSFGANPNGYLIYFPSTKKIVKARNVLFNEDPVIYACHEFVDSYYALERSPPAADDDGHETEPEVDAVEEDEVACGENVESTTITKKDDENAIDGVTKDYESTGENDEGAMGLEEVPCSSSDEDVDDRPIAIRKSRRNTRPPDRLTMSLNLIMAIWIPIQTALFAFSCAFTLFSKEPRSYKEALKSSDAKQWIEATDTERKALEDAGTYRICDPPPGAFIIPTKMVYKIKQKVDGSIDKYKARLCARGDLQEYGINYDETFAPVVKFATIRMIIALSTIMNWTIFQLDINSAYLYGKIDQEIYMHIPDGFYPSARKQGKVLKLLRSLYGLKQAGMIWFQLLHDFLLNNGFITSSLDRCCFVKRTKDIIIIVLTYVDDILYTSNSIEELKKFKDMMANRFKMKDLGELEYMVGLRIKRDGNKTTIDQSLYHGDILSRFNFTNERYAKMPLPESTILCPADEKDELANTTEYQSKVGSLMYSMLGCRPDLSFAVGQVARFMHKPTTSHLSYVHQIFRYVKFTINNGLKYVYNGGDDLQSRIAAVKLCAFSDADWAGDENDSKSTNGFIIMLAGAPIVWRSFKQRTVAKSSTEAETSAADECTNEIRWCREMLKFLGFEQMEATPLHMDNAAAMAGITKGNATKRNKFFRVRIDAMHESIKLKEITLVYMKSSELPADMLTKALSGPKILKHKQCISVVDIATL